MYKPKKRRNEPAYKKRKAGLVAEYHFFINPIAIGKGEGILDKLDGFQQLELTSSQVYDSGIVLLVYEPK